MTTAKALAEMWRGGALRVTTRAVAVLALLACGLAGWFGVSWFRAAHDESIALGMVRDTALLDAQQAAINVNTLDHRRVQDGLALWERSATGAALEEFRTNREANVRTLTDSKTSSTARIREGGAVADLNDLAGTARVLVGADVTYTAEQSSSWCVRQRLQMQMKRTPDGWKIEKIAPVGVLEPMPGACPSAEALPN
ncbi:MAG: hypothetical protein ACRDTG_19355 [Pseudonocardiaceae bacterium]